ncbi:MAG: hypothetical protein AAFQ80_24435 [Cyanobacteria bacterium J06621_8]
MISNLTGALDRIIDWLEKYSPISAMGFQSGLSTEVIEQKLSKLPYSVPQEVYELYGWRNGDKLDNSIFGYLWLLDLDSACRSSEYVNQKELLECRREAGEPQYLMPLFEFDGEYFAVQGDAKLMYSAPIFHVSDGYEVSLAFISLTGMMLAIAECYEIGIYALTRNGLGVIDPVGFGAIRRKYNPGTAEVIYAEGW